MRTITLPAPDDVDAWRVAARALIAEAIPPDRVVWQVGGHASDLFADADATTPTPAPAPSQMRVSRAFLDLAGDAALHRDPERFALLYAMLWRLREQPRLAEDHADPLVRRLDGLAKAVRRDIHKMRAFLRFRSIDDSEGDRKSVV